MTVGGRLTQLTVRISFFFFQAEDGIRDVAVTGVQTCALPILRAGGRPRGAHDRPGRDRQYDRHHHPHEFQRGSDEIGRASCRERVEISVVAVSLKKKKYRKTVKCTGVDVVYQS